MTVNCLSKNSEDELVLTAQGSGSNAEAAMCQLIALHRPHTKSIIRKLRIRSQVLEDADQSATLGLIRAIRHYVPGRGARLATFAYHYVRGQVIADVFGKPDDCLRTTSAGPGASADYGESLEYLSVPAPGDGPLDLVMAGDLARRLVQKLTPFETSVLTERYLNGGSHATVGKQLAVHPRRVSRAVARLQVTAEGVMISASAA